jgi:hypothetical protein
MQQQGLPSVGDMEPDWGHGSGSGNHVSDEGPDWAGHPYMDGADFNSARRKGMMFRRLRIRH